MQTILLTKLRKKSLNKSQVNRLEHHSQSVEVTLTEFAHYCQNVEQFVILTFSDGAEDEFLIVPSCSPFESKVRDANN